MSTYSQTLYKVNKTKKIAMNDVKVNDYENDNEMKQIYQGQDRGYPSKYSLGQVQAKVEKRKNV